VKRIIATLSLPFLLGAAARAQTGIASPTMYKTDTLIQNFLKTWNIPGATVAITRNGKLIYNRAFGYADQAKTEAMQPWHLQRIASNSKPITSIAIMKLVEDGKLKLNDIVFGPGKIINDAYYTGVITDSRIYNITVQQLLEHTAGWDRDQACDGYASCDPIGFPLHVTNTLGEGNPVKDSTLIKFLLKKGLNFAPGSKYAYSNIGYLVLAKVIERTTGMSYEDYVKSVIMKPLGLDDMHLGRNLLVDKQEREAEYTNSFTTQSCYGTGATVPWQYGGWNLEAMHAHGGWISSSEDYVKMILAVDKEATVPDILLPGTITTMTTPSAVNANYAKGWSVNSLGNWWHMGSLDGTSSFMAKSASGFTWAIHLNARDNRAAFANALDALPWNCIASTATYPTFDLFAPKTNAGAVTARRTGTGTARISWTSGNGDGRVVLVTEGTSWKSFPLEGADYPASGDYSTAINLGNGVMLAYSGTGSNVDITNLDPTKTYRFTVIELYRNPGTGNNAVYKYGGRSEAVLNMSATAINAAAGAAGQVSIRPNPAQHSVTLESGNPALIGTIAQLTDISGRRLRDIPLDASRVQIEISSFPSGVYFLRFADGSNLKLVKQ
jgi:CubicO group peptidase (beta-lactamase class C family)